MRDANTTGHELGPSHATAPVTIGVAEPAEYAEVAAVNVAAYEEFRARIDDVGWTRMHANISRIAKEAETSTVLVARGGDGILGSVLYYAPGTTIAPLPAEWASIRTLAVSPSARGRGVGEALVRDCIARARADGAAVLGLYTTAMMGPAIALYERLGFVRDADLPPRHGHPCWRYRLDL